MSVLTIALSADSSRRAFYKEFVKVVDAADVVIEVLDARDPLSCRCLDVERLVRRSGADKKVILLLNKIGESNRGYCCDALTVLHHRPFKKANMAFPVLLHSNHIHQHCHNYQPQVPSSALFREKLYWHSPVGGPAPLDKVWYSHCALFLLHAQQTASNVRSLLHHLVMVMQIWYRVRWQRPG